MRPQQNNQDRREPPDRNRQGNNGDDDHRRNDNGGGDNRRRGNRDQRQQREGRDERPRADQRQDNRDRDYRGGNDRRPRQENANNRRQDDREYRGDKKNDRDGPKPSNQRQQNDTNFRQREAPKEPYQSNRNNPPRNHEEPASARNPRPQYREEQVRAQQRVEEPKQPNKAQEKKEGGEVKKKRWIEKKPNQPEDVSDTQSIKAATEFGLNDREFSVADNDDTISVNTEFPQNDRHPNWQNNRQFKRNERREHKDNRDEKSNKDSQNNPYKRNNRDNRDNRNNQNQGNRDHPNRDNQQPRDLNKNKEHWKGRERRDNGLIPNLINMMEGPSRPNDSDSDSEEEGLFVPFETDRDRPNEGRMLKTQNIDMELQADEQRILKRAIKNYWTTRRKVSSISDIKIILDFNYPIVYLQYSLDDTDVQLNSLVSFMKAAWQHDNETQSVFRNLYNKNYEQLNQQEFKQLAPVATFRAQLLGKDYIATYNSKERRICRSMLSVVVRVPNRTLQFCFVDIQLSEITFNNHFIERYQERFPASYKLAQKKIAAIPVVNAEGNLVQNAVIADEQMSSDDERPVQHPTNINTEKKELQNLFSEDLSSFEDKINEKNNHLEEIMNDPNKQAQAEKLSQEISELDTTLKDYQAALTGFQAEYDNIDLTIADKAARDWKVHMIYKQLRILRNQLGSQLPIISRKRALFNLLNKENLIILEGETGSGKSTQLPQMLCEYFKIFNDQKAKPIVLTQPRKLSTRTLAERIAFEMDEKVHGFVDYVSSSGRNTLLAPNCKIIVKLDRLLLDEIEEDPLLQKYSCLVIDEAHERTISIDVIIGLIKEILSKRADFKVIITSATLDSALFEKYFKTKTFKVSGRMYPVTIKHMPFKSKESFIDKIYQCINTEIIPKGNIKNEYRGHILAFCTTVDEITQLCEKFKKILDPQQFVVCALHGRLDPAEQKKAFQQVGSKFKLVFSSRIAETAITIDKVKVVIDVGYDREMVYDQTKRISSFELMPISQSAAKQRAGRAGRTTAGFCFRLYEQLEEKEMRINKRPEIQGTPLDIVVLRLKQLQINNIETFPYLSAPPAENLRQSLETMQLIGCLDEKQQINEIGRTLVRIPIEPLLSRAIIDGLICEQIDKKCRITQRIIKVLAMVVNSNIFYSNDDNKETVEKIKFKEFADEDGDFFSLLNIYEAFEKESGRSVLNFCKQRYLNKKTLYQAQDLVKEISAIINGVSLNLHKLGEYVPWMKRKLQSFKSDKDLITSCLLSSFCQNICLYSGDAMIGYTHVRTETPVQIYGTSFLSLQGLAPKWIICYEIVKTSRTFCKVGQSVNFKMLQLSVQPQVFKKYKLDECEKFNPFYEIIDKSLPTIILKVFQQIKSQKDWMRQSKTKTEKFLGMFEHCECLVNQSTHQLKIYFIRNKQTQGLGEEIEKFITMYEEMHSNIYYYSFLGLNLVELNSGVFVKDIKLLSNIYLVELRNIPQETIDQIEYEYGSYCKSITKMDQQMTISFLEGEARDTFVRWFKNDFKLDQADRRRITIDLVDDSREKMKKVAKGILKIRFWAAERRSESRYDRREQRPRRGGNESRYLMLYPNPSHNKARLANQQQQQNAQKKFEENLKYTQEKLKEYFEKEEISFSITAKGNAINIQVNNPKIEDEFELEERLYAAYAENKLILPHLKVGGFRKIDTTLSSRNLNEWKKDIQKLAKWIYDDMITVRGFNSDRDQASSRDCYTDIWAEIHTFDSRDSQKFIKDYSGKRNVLGSEKVHASMVYKQSITRMKSCIFKVFKNKFENLKDFALAEDPTLDISQREWTGNDGVSFVFLDISAPKRNALLKPIEQLRKFVTKVIEKIDPSQSRTLNSYQGNRKILNSLFDQIEWEFNYRIYLDFNYRRNEIEIYCADEKEEKEVVDYLRKQLLKFKKVETRISYRGKNIYKVKQILDDFSKRITFNLSLSERCVYVNGKLEDVEQCSNEINRIVNEHKAECDICYNLLSIPIKLFDCRHEFCANCLIENVRGINDDPKNFPLQCPSYEKCGKYINIYDLQYILDQEEFTRTCDTGISRLIDNKKYHGCETPFCKQIFEFERTKNDGGMYQCGVCNLNYCHFCRGTAHPRQTCEQARIIALQDQCEEIENGLAKGAHQICDKCDKRIYRNGNSYKVVCECGAYVCWVCCKIFRSDKALCAHLTDKHQLPTN